MLMPAMKKPSWTRACELRTRTENSTPPAWITLVSWMELLGNVTPPTRLAGAKHVWSIKYDAGDPAPSTRIMLSCNETAMVLSYWIWLLGIQVIYLGLQAVWASSSGHNPLIWKSPMASIANPRVIVAEHSGVSAKHYTIAKPEDYMHGSCGDKSLDSLVLRLEPFPWSICRFLRFKHSYRLLIRLSGWFSWNQHEIYVGS